jgi:hypothetical protein
MNSGQDRFHISNPRTLLRRFEFASVVAAPYVIAIVWQYFCTFKPASLAWGLTTVVSAVVWIFYLSLADDSSPLSWHFWALVALPLLCFYLIRLPFPDVSFDVLNYHIFHGERALRGPLLASGDFFPTPAPFNPTPDILTGLYRYAFGYRLGTVANFLALVWTATIINRILRDWITTAWVRSLATLGVVATEQLLFQINNYMVDLLALPLLLEATRIALKTTSGQRLVRQTILLALLLGTAATFKLANLIYAVPIILIYLFNVLAAAERSNRFGYVWSLAKIAPIASIVFALPLLPFTILIYRLTGNPVFPLYNGLFKSPFWPQGALFDPRWGPYGIIETISWPVMLFFRPARLSEYPFYSGRLSIGFLIALALIFLARRNRMIWQMAFITLFGAIVWSASSGYIRYALYLELTSGILIVWLLFYFWKMFGETNIWRGRLILTPFTVLLLLHLSFAIAHGYRWEWSARATVFQHRLRYDFEEAANVLRDRSLAMYIAPEEMNAFQNVDGWIETTYKTSAIAALLKPGDPALGVRLGEYFLTPVARRKFTDVLKAHQGQRMFTLTDRDNYENARAELAARSLGMGNSRPLSIYYFSRSVKFELLLVEVLPKESPNSRTPGVAEKGVPLPDSAFNAKLSVVTMPDTMRAGQKYDLRIALKNESDLPWPGRQATWQFQLTVGNRWLKQSGEKVTDIDARAALLNDLASGFTVEIPLTVTAPGAPGIYILQLDAIQEGVAWFGERGSEVLSLKVKVE